MLSQALGKSVLATVVLVAVLIAAGATAAQVTTGSILIRTTDEQGAVLPGVTVSISSPALVAKQVVGVTDGGGAYRLPALVPGAYEVKVELAGFQTIIREQVIVSVGQTTPLDFKMVVAGVEETLTVVGSPTVDTTSANVAVAISQDLLQSTPGGRDILGLIEYKVPGLVIQRPDVGGGSGGMQGRFTSKGTPGTESTQWLNGINVANPGAPGNMGFYYDYDAFEEVQVSTGAHDLSVPTSGVFLNMVTKTGSDRFAGKGTFLWQGDRTQARNVDQNLRQFGLREDDNITDFVSDATFHVGGPIVAEKLRFFSAFRDWRIHVRVPDFPETEDTDMTSGLGSLTWQINPRNRLTGLYSRQHRLKPNRGANALLTPESTQFEDDRFYIAQGLWNSVLSDATFMEAGISYLHIFFPARQKGAEQSLLDLSTGKRTRAAASGLEIFWPRLQTHASVQHYVDRALGGRHELRVGVQVSHSPTSTATTRIDDLNLTYRSQTNTASTVTFFNSPVESRSTVTDFGVYAQDSYTFKRLTLIGGVRWERAEGYLPEQSSPPSQWFPNATREFAAIRNVINWRTLAPRVNLAFDLMGDGRTALTAAAGRYYYALSTGQPNSVNPNFQVNETYAWNDLNGNLLFEPAERGALLSRGGGSLTSFDPDLRRPYTDELLVGVSREVLPDLKLSAIFTYREERDRYSENEVGVPFSAYQLVSRTDPGRDGLLGTGDDATLFVWDQDRATLGQNRQIIANSSAFNQLYRGLEISASKRLSNNWQLLASYTLSRVIENASPGVLTPNLLINSRGPTFFDKPHNFKLTGTYILPYDVVVGGNLRMQSGAPVGQLTGTFTEQGDPTRRATFSLTQGNVTVNAEPRGSDRFDSMTTIDLRVAKIFGLAGRQELELMVDAYNLTNANTVWAARTVTGRISVREGGTGEVINQPNYRSPLFALAPRIFRVGASFRF